MTEEQNNPYQQFKWKVNDAFTGVVDTYLERNKIHKIDSIFLIRSATDLVMNRYDSNPEIIKEGKRLLKAASKDGEVFLKLTEFVWDSRLTLTRFTTSVGGEYLWIIFYDLMVIGYVVSEGDSYKKGLIESEVNEQSPTYLFHHELAERIIIVNEDSRLIGGGKIETRLSVKASGYEIYNYDIARLEPRSEEEIETTYKYRSHLISNVTSAVENYLDTLEEDGDPVSSKEEVMMLISNLLDKHSTNNIK